MAEILDKMTPEHWLAVFFFLLLVTWGVAILLFNRISLKYLDKEMAKEGITPPEWDKGIGARGIMYAIVIVMDKVSKDSLLDDEAILRHTRATDRKLAKFYVISSILIFTVGGIVYYLYGPSD